MKKSFLIAISVIIVPVLIFFAGSAGKQNFQHLPFMGERIEPNGADVKDTIFYAVPDFKLTSQTGEIITQKTFDNKIYIANFFFASCKDVCPKMNAKVATVFSKIKEQKFAEIKFLSITVDPENDSVPVLSAYAKKFKADPSIWYFATGTSDDIFKAGQGFLVPVSKEDQTIDHSQQLLLIDKEKHIRGIYNGLDEVELARLKDEIKVLLYEYHTNNK